MQLIKYFVIFCLSFGLHAKDHSSDREKVCLHGWKGYTILKPSEKKSARTAILIISPPYINQGLTEQRWQLGKKTWEMYMNSHSNVDCYFLQCTLPCIGETEENQVWIEGNTIYVGDWWYEKYGKDRILHKTIAALEKLLPDYTHFVRTNLNTFFNLTAVDEYMCSHHQAFYTTPLWEWQWYAIGYGIVLTKEVAAHIVKEYRRLEKTQAEFVSCYHPDDAVLTSLATGVWPYDRKHPFQSCSALPFGSRQLMSIDGLAQKRLNSYAAFLLPPISLQEAIHFSNLASKTVMLYRVKEGMTLDELTQFYQHLLNKHYFSK